MRRTRLENAALTEAKKFFAEGKHLSHGRRHLLLETAFAKSMSKRRAVRTVLLYVCGIVSEAGQDLVTLTQAWLCLGERRFQFLIRRAWARVRRFISVLDKIATALSKPIRLEDIFQHPLEVLADLTSASA